MRVPSIVALAVLATLACDKKDSETGPAASSVAPPASAVPWGSTPWHFAIEPKGTAHVDMAGAKQHIQGDTSAAMGSLDVIAADLSKSHGSVMIDLSTFTTTTFGNQDDAAQTKQARTWLEVAQPQMRWASLAIRSIDALSATDLSKVPATKDGPDDVRSVTMTLHGDLLLHDSKVAEDCPIEARFHYPTGAAPDVKPTRIEITSKEPMRVTLKDVNVQPRDSHGKALHWTADLLAKVAPSADVTVNLDATPAM